MVINLINKTSFADAISEYRRIGIEITPWSHIKSNPENDAIDGITLSLGQDGLSCLVLNEVELGKFLIAYPEGSHWPLFKKKALFLILFRLPEDGSTYGVRKIKSRG